MLSWYIPTSNVREFGGQGVFYANRWKNAQEVDAAVRARLDELQSRTRLFHDTLYDSNLPRYVLDRLTSQMATLHTPVVFWAQNGFFGGFEGHGCCTSMPTHVWQYAQLAQRLWPEIDRKWTTQWLDNELPGGLIPYRFIAPQFAMDGQNGVILGAYRYWLGSGDRDWLRSRWLKLKQAMDFVITRHDPDRDGIVTGEQLTTLDSMSSGANPWLGTMYLAALRATQHMATAAGDLLSAKGYETLFATGRANQERLLWNGGWYVERPEPRAVAVPEKSPVQDLTTLTGSATTSFGNGVIADMLLGQWWAGQLGLGDIYDPAHMTTAMRTLFEQNFRENFHGHDLHGGRVFVEPDDKGLVMMSWPQGDRPADATKYADEVWSGQEYSSAALMIQRGLVDEGLRMVRAISDRYDGRLRTKVSRHNCAALDGGGNPFGDDECGKWYARAMSNWSVLLALQGFQPRRRGAADRLRAEMAARRSPHLLQRRKRLGHVRPEPRRSRASDRPARAEGRDAPVASPGLRHRRSDTTRCHGHCRRASGGRATAAHRRRGHRRARALGRPRGGPDARGRAAMKRLAVCAVVAALLAVGGESTARAATTTCVPRSTPIAQGAATRVSESVVGGSDGRLRTEVLESPALGGRTRVNVLLPKGYDPTGATRYPVLYLLHGALADYNDWNYSGRIMQLVDGVTAQQRLPPFIVVMPDGGHYGWYSDWYGTDIGATGTPPAWSQYHVGELIPWIDTTFPTTADRSGRAIAGLSMGGFGAMSYAARHPDLFAAAGSFSGALNPTYGPGYGEAFVTLASAYFNDLRVTQCMWGDAVTQRVRWYGHDPTYLAGNIAATHLFVAAGGGDADQPRGIAPNPADITSPVGMISTPVEETCFLMSRAFTAALDAAGIAHTDDYYGSGTHEMTYWRAELEKFLPKMAAAWAEPPPPPAKFSYRSIASRFAVWGWSFQTHRNVAEFTYLRGVGRSGLDVIGSGRLGVVSAPLYTPGARYRVSRAGTERVVAADADGRLSFSIDLGPAHRGQQRSFDEAALDSWVRAVVAIEPSA